MSADGEVLFARFAHPPNALGYCGPAEGKVLLASGASGEADAAVAGLARGFDGAWPYLELLAGAAGVDDPLDRVVVEAYWLGTGPARTVDPDVFAQHLSARIGGRTGTDWEDIAAAIVAGGLPNHAFHVFSVYPWVGLLRRGVVDEALRVLDQCRIRWGRVTAIEGERALVRSRPLRWDGERLDLGAPRIESARLERDGLALAGTCSAGDLVALHWDWVCTPLDWARLDALRTAAHHQFEVVNRHAAAPVGNV